MKYAFQSVLSMNNNILNTNFVYLLTISIHFKVKIGSMRHLKYLATAWKTALFDHVEIKTRASVYKTLCP